jgi:hypothetical protein
MFTEAALQNVITQVEPARQCIRDNEAAPAFTMKLPPGLPDVEHDQAALAMTAFAEDVLDPFQGTGWTWSPNFCRETGIYCVTFWHITTPATVRVDAAIDDLREVLSPADLEKTRRSMMGAVIPNRRGKRA